MLKIFNAFILTLTVIYILSCNQNSDNIQKWAIKTDPDGRIKHYYSRFVEKPNGEIRYINDTKPDDYEWTQNTPSNYISVDDRTLDTDYSGIGNEKNGKLFYQYIDSIFEDPTPKEHIAGYLRQSAFENFYDELCHARFRSGLFKDLSNCKKFIYSPINDKGVSNDISEMGSREFPFYAVEASGHDVSFTYHQVEDTQTRYIKTNGEWEIDIDDPLVGLGRYVDEFSITIDEDKLTYRSNILIEAGENPKNQIITEKYRIAISGPSYSTEDEFFKKLEEIQLAKERWRLNNTLEPPDKWSDDGENLLCGRIKRNDPLIGHGTALCETHRKEFNRSPHYVLSIIVNKDTVEYIPPGWLRQGNNPK